MHCFEGYIIRVDETRDFPRGDEPTKDRSNNNPTSVRLTVRNGTIQLRQTPRASRQASF
jgi:hypothetical protein